MTFAVPNLPARSPSLPAGAVRGAWRGASHGGEDVGPLHALGNCLGARPNRSLENSAEVFPEYVHVEKPDLDDGTARPGAVDEIDVLRDERKTSKELPPAEL